MPRRYAKPNGNRRYRKNYRRTNQSLAKKAYALAKKNAKNTELKYHEETNSHATLLNTGVIIGIDNMAQGITNNTRIGDRVSPTSLRMKHNLTWGNANLFRLIVFRWISESPAAVTDILQAANATSFKSEAARYQSEILYDHTYVKDADKPVIQINKKFKLSKQISYDGASGIVPSRNGIYYIALTDVTSASTCTFAGGTRLYFKDA